MLRFVFGESLVLAIDVWRQVDPRGYRSQRDRRALLQRELRGYVVELPGLPGSQPCFKLVRVAILARGPLESSRGEQSGHAVVGMGGDKAIGSEGDNYVRAQSADEVHQPARDFVKVLAIQGAVGVVQHLAVSHAKMMAGVGKFLAAYRLQRFVIGDAAAVGGALSGR